MITVAVICIKASSTMSILAFGNLVVEVCIHVWAPIDGCVLLMESSRLITVEILMHPSFCSTGKAAPALFHTAGASQLLPGGN